MNTEDQVLVVLLIGIAAGVLLSWFWVVACEWMDD